MNNIISSFMVLEGVEDDETFYHLLPNGLKIQGLFGVKDDSLIIYEWRSFSPGNGNSSLALMDLRNTYKFIVVKDIGTKNDESWRYWVHMRDKGLVDELYDGYGVLIC